MRFRVLLTTPPGRVRHPVTRDWRAGGRGGLRVDGKGVSGKLAVTPSLTRGGAVFGGAGFQPALPPFLAAFFIFGVLLRHGRLAGTNRRKPPVAVRLRAVDDSEELLLQLLRDRAAPSLADGNAVHRADGRDLGGGAGEEYFIGDVQQFPRDDGLYHRDSQIARQRDDAVAGDAREHRSAQRRSEDLTVAHDEDVLARSLADVAGRVERDALAVAVDQGFHLDELRVHVVGARLSEGRQRIRRDAGPTGDAHVHALRERFLAKILAPFPASNVNVDGVLEPVDPDFPVTAQRDGAQIARVHLVQAHQFLHRFGQFGRREADVLHAVNPGGIQHAPDVLVQTEDGRSSGRGIAPDTFEYRGAVVHHVREDVNRGFFPGDEAPVVPNLFGRRHTD